MAGQEEEINPLPKSILLRWDIILAHFETHFQSVFATSKKAHFDSVPVEYRVVDGARARWWPLLVFDGMLHLLMLNTWSFASRRAFNQHRVFFDAVLAAIEDADSDLFQELSRGQHSNILSISPPQATPLDDQVDLEDGWHRAVVCLRALPGLTITPMPVPWQSYVQLKEQLLVDPPTKSKLKFLLIIEYFMQHALSRRGGLEVLVKHVLAKVIVHFACGLYSDDPAGRTAHNFSHSHPVSSAMTVSFPSSANVHPLTRAMSAARVHHHDEGQVLGNHTKLKKRRRNHLQPDGVDATTHFHHGGSSPMAVGPRNTNITTTLSYDDLTVHPDIFDDFYSHDSYTTDGDFTSPNTISPCSQQSHLLGSEGHVFYASPQGIHVNTVPQGLTVCCNCLCGGYHSSRRMASLRTHIANTHQSGPANDSNAPAVAEFFSSSIHHRMTYPRQSPRNQGDKAPIENSGDMIEEHEEHNAKASSR
eukprot:scaffold7410_cov169-Ochromonas_danica.AAC.17